MYNTFSPYCALSWSVMLFDCIVPWKEVKEREETRKHRTYCGAKCSIVECWFSLNANWFVKCTYMRTESQLWIDKNHGICHNLEFMSGPLFSTPFVKHLGIPCIHSSSWLYKSINFFCFRKQGYIQHCARGRSELSTVQGEGANLEHRGSSADACVTRLLNRLSACCLSADLICADLSLKKEPKNSTPRQVLAIKPYTRRPIWMYRVPKYSFSLLLFEEPKGWQHRDTTLFLAGCFEI
jgi:hypothetical protein